jgi:hypothetical protein
VTKRRDGRLQGFAVDFDLDVFVIETHQAFDLGALEERPVVEPDDILYIALT